MATDNGHDVFLDLFKLDAAADIRSTLKKKIDWCDYFIVVLSRNALKSKWVNFELGYARQSELNSGEKKIFAIQIDDSNLPRILADYLVLDFSAGDKFTPNFFKLMYSILQKPTHYEVAHRVINDPEKGYLFDLWIQCVPEFMARIDLVEYRFDYEFDYGGYNATILDGAVHTEENRKKKFGIREVWTDSSITIFVAVYLKNTKVLYFRKFVEVGVAIN
jgi:hypothetical protein